MKNLTNFSAKDNGEASIYIVLLKALIMCFISSLIMVIAYALILSYSSMSDESIAKVTQIIVIISISLSGIYGGKRIKRKGWLFGLVLGLSFVLMLIPITIAFGQKFAFDMYFSIKMIMGSSVGLIGGVIGVNLST